MLAEPRQEFAFTDRDFEFLRALVSEHAGIALGEHKRQLVYGRLTRRLRQLQIPTFGEYCAYVQHNLEHELGEVINAITTNLTAFFRENHHFEHLAGSALPDLAARNAANRRLRLWSAGCSTGEEPYSIAMTLAESLPELAAWDAKILATDIDSQVLARAAAGEYADERVRDLAGERLRRWFQRGAGAHAGKVRVADGLRQLIAFRRLNLMEAWPIRGPFDAIFCRNVVIYFDKPTQKALFDRFADLLVSEGYLYVGHSETLYRTCDRFRLVGRTIYQKIA
jgi:chemotaxis protein methyltransferase CheR